MSGVTEGTFVPAPAAALAGGISRERIVRLIQRGEVVGKLANGRWFVAVGEVERLRQSAAQAADA